MSDSLVDIDARRRALIDLDASLLVEASAGAGKTAIMAGRVAMLLVAGRDPASIAAVTFTELAAAELGVRIRELVEALLSGDRPRVLSAVLPEGLNADQRQTLAAAVNRLDDLTTTTIHGFCLKIIRAYAVEADIDPGATVMDAGEADALFQTTLLHWLRRRLSIEAPPGPVLALAEDDPLGVVETLRSFAALRRDHPTATAPSVDSAARPDLDFADAVQTFARWFRAGPAEVRTATALQQIEVLAAFFQDCLASKPDFTSLLRLSRPPRQPFMRDRSLIWKVFRSASQWRVLAGDDGTRLADEADAHYDRCHKAFQAMIGQIGSHLAADLAGALDEPMASYADRKRAAAALDFDDLMTKALQLVRNQEPVRAALHARYRHLLVDEFQDTDLTQSEIIFRLASETPAEDWRAAPLRPGGLFLVGDPKQAIYRFRGADAEAYAEVRRIFEAWGTDAILQLRANFRSRPEILEHVNSCFSPVLSASGQPGYVALAATRERSEGAPCAVRLSIPVTGSASSQRDAEAEVIAEVCRRLIGAIEVPRDKGPPTPLRPGDIALLAPTKTDLWRYERALEAQRLSVASQAGEALMRRQETQDILALARTLADPFDTLAFGALLRGPLVGLTETQLLDVVGGLAPAADGRPAQFTVTTPREQVNDPLAQRVLSILQDLRRRSVSLTPLALLSEAVERLDVRVILTLRVGDRSARALANLDALLERARPYAVRGLQDFARDLDADWSAKTRCREGRTDESDDAVSIVTMHSAKGLEWPVVIPINTSTQLYRSETFIHRQSDDTLHWVVGGVAPPELEAAQAEEGYNARLERERIWYVACTRARDLLILPHMVGLDGLRWAGLVDLRQTQLPELDLSSLPVTSRPRRAEIANQQSADLFDEEAARISAATRQILWCRPSDHDPDRIGVIETVAETTDAPPLPVPLGAGRLRGVLLHKLMEELLSGELEASSIVVIDRARILWLQLAAQETLEPVGPPQAEECAATALRTLHLPALASLRAYLVPEATIYGTRADGALVAGRMDAAAIKDGQVFAVLDWKSDVAPSAEERVAYAAQVVEYLLLTGAPRGALVFMSHDEVVWIERPRLAPAA